MLCISPEIHERPIIHIPLHVVHILKEKNGLKPASGLILPPMASNDYNYSEEHIRTLDWIEHMRLRPGMYIGKTGRWYLSG